MFTEPTIVPNGTIFLFTLLISSQQMTLRYNGSNNYRYKPINCRRPLSGKSLLQRERMGKKNVLAPSILEPSGQYFCCVLMNRSRQSHFGQQVKSVCATIFVYVRSMGFASPRATVNLKGVSFQYDYQIGTVFFRDKALLGTFSPDIWTRIRHYFSPDSPLID